MEEKIIYFYKNVPSKMFGISESKSRKKEVLCRGQLNIEIYTNI